MSLEYSDGTIRLLGNCTLEEAEMLLQLLLDHPGAVVDWSDCSGLHGAVLQTLMAGRRRMVGEPADEFLRRWMAPALMIHTNSR
ncbi:hypothetical protein [Niveispirillum sp. KHB5.9]|uniref:hypothetical protein n=1 Tax=Niveispirillum sp. KHB5.9 TaxID=3400269 RepID=UPI003A8C88B3